MHGQIENFGDRPDLDLQERMQSFEDCQSGISLAIVPSKEGWSVVMNARGRNDNPRCAKRIEQLQASFAGLHPGED